MRIAFNLEPSTLAILAGLTPEDIINYEEKEYQNTSFITVLTISDILGIKINNGVLTAELDNFSQQSLNLKSSSKVSERVGIAS